MDFSRMWKVAKWTVGVGAVLVFLQFLLTTGVTLISLVAPIVGGIVGILALGVSLLALPVFFVLYVHLAHKAAKKNGMQPVDAGLTVVLASAVLGFLSLIAQGINALLVTLGVVGQTALGGGGAGSTAMAGAGGAVGAAGGLLCGAGVWVASIVLNFVIGLICGYIWKTEKPAVVKPSEVPPVQKAQKASPKKGTADGGKGRKRR